MLRFPAHLQRWPGPGGCWRDTALWAECSTEAILPVGSKRPHPYNTHSQSGPNVTVLKGAGGPGRPREPE